MIINTKYQSET